MKGRVQEYKLALFRKVPKTNKSKREVSIMDLMCFGHAAYDTTPKQETNETTKPKVPRYTLEFVCFCKTEADIAEAVRKQPHSKYVLFRGQAVEVQVAMPVFAGGANLNTFMAEWGE